MSFLAKLLITMLLINVNNQAQMLLKILGASRTHVYSVDDLLLRSRGIELIEGHL